MTTKNQLKQKSNSQTAYKKAFPTPPLFMMAQLPFNTKETVSLNSPMIPIMDDKGNTCVARRNLKQLGVWKKILQHKSAFLEIGCGSGYLLEHLYQNGKGSYFGIEPIKSEYSKAQKKLKSYLPNQDSLQHGLLEQAKLKSKSLDFIYSYHVYEHLENPLLMLELGKKWLKPGGKMIITCPNVEGFMPRWNIDSWRCSLPSHRWLPGLKVLRHTLKRHHYIVRKTFTYGGFPTPRNLLTNVFNQAFKAFNLGDVVCIMAEKSN